MKKFALLLSLLVLLTGCAPAAASPQVVATTRPVYDFTSRLCENTDISVSLLVTQSVSCLHDYTLQVRQMRAVESCSLLVISGGGLEEFLSDVLPTAETVCDASEGIPLLCADTQQHSHEHGEHHHASDPHIWLSPYNAKIMAENICSKLTAQFPENRAVFSENLQNLLADLDTLSQYGQENLSSLAANQLLTFHDGFSYFADAFGISILRSVEEESGSEASAADLIELITLVNEHRLPAIFTEAQGSSAAASIIARETGTVIFTLDMAMGDRDYFTAMYHNIDTIKEALG